MHEQSIITAVLLWLELLSCSWPSYIIISSIWSSYIIAPRYGNVIVASVTKHSTYWIKKATSGVSDIMGHTKSRVNVHIFQESMLWNYNYACSDSLCLLSMDLFFCHHRNYKCKVCSQDCRVYSYGAWNSECMIIICHQIMHFMSSVNVPSMACKYLDVDKKHLWLSSLSHPYESPRH